MTGTILKNNLFLPVSVLDTLFSPRFLRQRSGAFCSCPLSPHFWVGKKVQTFPVCLLCTRPPPNSIAGWGEASELGFQIDAFSLSSGQASLCDVGHLVLVYSRPVTIQRNWSLSNHIQCGLSLGLHVWAQIKRELMKRTQIWAAKWLEAWKIWFNKKNENS